MIDIWSDAEGEKAIRPLNAAVCRLVESQEQVATLSLVSNVFEQGILEELIETTKSPLVEDSDSLHYLLKTPFRYPPLKYGSRFGATFERGIFYGSLNVLTALAETAYYRFVYMLGPEVPYQKIISSGYTEFSVWVKSENGIFLDESPFATYESILTSPISYVDTQQLGANMRLNGVEIFRYISARDKNKGKNVALFTPKAFYSKKPSKFIGWLCQTSIEEVGFVSKAENIRVLFKQNDFWIDGIFPSPAT